MKSQPKKHTTRANTLARVIGDVRVYGASAPLTNGKPYPLRWVLPLSERRKIARAMLAERAET